MNSIKGGDQVIPGRGAEVPKIPGFKRQIGQPQGTGFSRVGRNASSQIEAGEPAVGESPGEAQKRQTSSAAGIQHRNAIRQSI